MRAYTMVGAAALVIAVVTGCAPQPADGGETPVPPDGATPSATTTPEPGVRQFGMPETCAEIITAETAAEFEASGLDLLGGPGGLYGENYFGDPTPEERAGGITCVWGDEAVPASTVIVSVAPNTPSTHSGIVSALIASGLVESQADGALTYARIGDEVSAPAELHVIRTDSWISVIEAVGGEDRFEHAREIVDVVTEQVYPEG
jgi:hypothetical protein